MLIRADPNADPSAQSEVPPGQVLAHCSAPNQRNQPPIQMSLAAWYEVTRLWPVHYGPPFSGMGTATQASTAGSTGGLESTVSGHRKPNSFDGTGPLAGLESVVSGYRRPHSSDGTVTIPEDAVSPSAQKRARQGGNGRPAVSAMVTPDSVKASRAHQSRASTQFSSMKSGFRSTRFALDEDIAGLDETGIVDVELIQTQGLCTFAKGVNRPQMEQPRLADEGQLSAFGAAPRVPPALPVPLPAAEPVAVALPVTKTQSVVKAKKRVAETEKEEKKGTPRGDGRFMVSVNMPEQPSVSTQPPTSSGLMPDVLNVLAHLQDPPSVSQSVVKNNTVSHAVQCMPEQQQQQQPLGLRQASRTWEVPCEHTVPSAHAPSLSPAHRDQRQRSCPTRASVVTRRQCTPSVVPSCVPSTVSVSSFDADAFAPPQRSSPLERRHPDAVWDTLMMTRPGARRSSQAVSSPEQVQQLQQQIQLQLQQQREQLLQQQGRPTVPQPSRERDAADFFGQVLAVAAENGAMVSGGSGATTGSIAQSVLRPPVGNDVVVSPSAVLRLAQSVHSPPRTRPGPPPVGAEGAKLVLRMQSGHATELDVPPAALAALLKSTGPAGVASPAAVRLQGALSPTAVPDEFTSLSPQHVKSGSGSPQLPAAADDDRLPEHFSVIAPPHLQVGSALMYAVPPIDMPQDVACEGTVTLGVELESVVPREFREDLSCALQLQHERVDVTSVQQAAAGAVAVSFRITGLAKTLSAAQKELARRFQGDAVRAVFAPGRRCGPVVSVSLGQLPPPSSPPAPHQVQAHPCPPPPPPPEEEEEEVRGDFVPSPGRQAVTRPLPPLPAPEGGGVTSVLTPERLQSPDSCASASAAASRHAARAEGASTRLRVPTQSQCTVTQHMTAAAVSPSARRAHAARGTGLFSTPATASPAGSASVSLPAEIFQGEAQLKRLAAASLCSSRSSLPAFIK
eukprot:Hpha_TRINITY_DN16141_c3_g2::TRINITY_DN16141_c3_g2_i1::g.6022::m.6022